MSGENIDLISKSNEALSIHENKEQTEIILEDSDNNAAFTNSREPDETDLNQNKNKEMHGSDPVDTQLTMECSTKNEASDAMDLSANLKEAIADQEFELQKQIIGRYVMKCKKRKDEKNEPDVKPANENNSDKQNNEIEFQQAQEVGVIKLGIQASDSQSNIPAPSLSQGRLTDQSSDTKEKTFRIYEDHLRPIEVTFKDFELKKILLNEIIKNQQRFELNSGSCAVNIINDDEYDDFNFDNNGISKGNNITDGDFKSKFITRYRPKPPRFNKKLEKDRSQLEIYSLNDVQNMMDVEDFETGENDYDDETGFSDDDIEVISVSQTNLQTNISDPLLFDFVPHENDEECFSVNNSFPFLCVTDECADRMDYCNVDQSNNFLLEEKITSTNSEDEFDLTFHVEKAVYSFEDVLQETSVSESNNSLTGYQERDFMQLSLDSRSFRQIIESDQDCSLNIVSRESTSADPESRTSSDYQLEAQNSIFSTASRNSQYFTEQHLDLRNSGVLPTHTDASSRKVSFNFPEYNNELPIPELNIRNEPLSNEFLEVSSIPEILRIRLSRSNTFQENIKSNIPRLFFRNETQIQIKLIDCSGSKIPISVFRKRREQEKYLYRITGSPEFESPLPPRLFKPISKKKENVKKVDNPLINDASEEKPQPLNLLLTRDGLFFQVLSKQKTGKGQDIMFFQEASRDAIGACLPSLNPKNPCKNLKQRFGYHYAEELDPFKKVEIAGYSQPLPLARDISLPQKGLSQRYRLVHLLKMKRELTLQEQVGFNILHHSHDPDPNHTSFRRKSLSRKQRTTPLPKIGPKTKGGRFYSHQNQLPQQDMDDAQSSKEEYKPLKHINRTRKLTPACTENRPKPKNQILNASLHGINPFHS